MSVETPTKLGDWDSLPLDVLASVAAYLRPKYIADARLVCKSWCEGISLGVKQLQPKLQSPLGGRTGSLAGLYVYAMRWHEMSLLLVRLDDLRELTGCCHYLSRSLGTHMPALLHALFGIQQFSFHLSRRCVQRAFPSCKKLNLHHATMTIDCAKYFAHAHGLKCIQIRSETFCTSSGSPALSHLSAFAMELQVSIIFYDATNFGVLRKQLPPVDSQK
jgi:hypothetical protein